MYLLLVENNYISSREIKNLLDRNKIDCEVLKCSSSDSLLDIAGKLSPDIVVIDFDFYINDSEIIVQKLRKFSPGAYILAFVDSDHFTKLYKAIEIGIDDYMVKPLQHEDIILRVKLGLQRKGMHNQSNVTSEKVVKQKDLFIDLADAFSRKIEEEEAEVGQIYNISDESNDYFVRQKFSVEDEIEIIEVLDIDDDEDLNSVTIGEIEDNIEETPAVLEELEDPEDIEDLEELKGHDEKSELEEDVDEFETFHEPVLDYPDDLADESDNIVTIPVEEEIEEEVVEEPEPEEKPEIVHSLSADTDIVITDEKTEEMKSNEGWPETAAAKDEDLSHSQTFFDDWSYSRSDEQVLEESESEDLKEDFIEPENKNKEKPEVLESKREEALYIFDNPPEKLEDAELFGMHAEQKKVDSKTFEEIFGANESEPTGNKTDKSGEGRVEYFFRAKKSDKQDKRIILEKTDKPSGNGRSRKITGSILTASLLMILITISVYLYAT
ncbi:MAG: response regulator [Bacillota bacterium]|nr:response regulator [Bacillota bacterium]